MKKVSFYTMKGGKPKPVAVLVDGFFDGDTNLHFYKSGSGEWYSVCILTGLSIGHGKTRKECIERTLQLMPQYQELRLTERFNEMVDRYNKAVRMAITGGRT